MMSTIAIIAFVFMLISSLLGFLAALAWKNNAQKRLKDNLSEVQKKVVQLNSQLKGLQEHANRLEKQKANLVSENEGLIRKLSILLGDITGQKESSNLMQNDGYIDTSNYDQKINDLNAQVDKLHEEMDLIKRESLEWQVQYTEVLKEKEELTLQLLTLRNSSNL